MLGGFALLGESYGFAPQRLMGDLYGVATAVFFGAYVLAVRAARARHGAAEVMFVSTAITAACLFVIALAFEPRILPQSMHRRRRAARARDHLAGRRTGAASRSRSARCRRRSPRW